MKTYRLWVSADTLPPKGSGFWIVRRSVEAANKTIQSLGKPHQIVYVGG